ncbi:hypothetical protein PS710_00606 [Pseudomonas fluorescens]|uniref:Transposase n=1 Tax=Pseudomonas fluorescens TaxID=294 RepID=A0A5E7A557_PSEFL|nr:hypothetical protein PS710_00606 [Pseudomonas fluorescens]
MKRFIGEHLGQSTLPPESLDEYVSDTNPVRVVDVFVDELDLVNLGFDAITANTGRPLVAIDGSKFKAVNHRDRNFTSAKYSYYSTESQSFL